MRVRDANALARACDLGVAMQLTNIARDVGEDARAGRIYLPLEWLDEVGLTPEALLACDTATPEVRRLVRRLLSEARRLYLRSESGVPALPVGARTGIYAARHIYAGIGSALARSGHNSVTMRARTTTPQKLGWMVLSAARAAGSTVFPRSPVLYARPLDEVSFLVNAAANEQADNAWGAGRTGALLSALADLKTQDAAVNAARQVS